MSFRPNYDVTLRFQYSSNTTQLSSILEMVDFMVSSAEWIYQEDLTISNTLDISHLQTYSTQIQASLKIVLEGCMATSGLWDVLRVKEPLSQYSSLFNYRTALTGIELPTVEQLSSIVELLNIILRQIHSLGRYYRQLSLYYCELCLLSGDNSQMCQVDEFKRIFFNLMNDVENVVKNHLQGWKFVVLVCGHTLLRQQIIPTTPSPQEYGFYYPCRLTIIGTNPIFC